MIQALSIDRLRRHVRAALEEQCYRDRHGVLGVPASPDGHLWDKNADVTAILVAVDEAVALTWSAGDLQVRGRYDVQPHHFRLFRDGDGGGDAPSPIEVRAYAEPASCLPVPGWEVTDPAGTVLIRFRDCDIDLADDYYHHAPAGSHLRPVAATGLAAPRTRMAALRGAAA